ncbi:MAG TPA: glycosyltransferase family 39 protein [Acidimicrobiia bacterium]
MNRAERSVRSHDWVVDVVVLGLAAALLRLPSFFASRHLLFDDGVYGASAVAMRAGALPFREVFSSQGPLFLPLVYAFDALGGRTLDAPRLLALTSGVAVTLAVYATGRQVTTRGGALLAAGLVAASGSVLWTTGPLTSDGPGAALACAAVAVAVAYRRTPSTRLAVVVGVLAGAAFAVKSLLVVPALVAVGLLLLGRRRFGDVALAVGIAVAVLIAVTVPWGVHNVIDQSVGYHTDQATHQAPAANFTKTLSTLGDRDAPLLGAAILAAAAAAVAAIAARRRPTPARSGRSSAHDADQRPNSAVSSVWWERATSPPVAIAVWLVLALVVLVLESPMWRNHVAHLVPPAALLVGIYRPPWWTLLLAALVLVPYHAVHIDGLLAPTPYRGDDARLERALKALPAGAQAISDDPGFVWRSGHATPPGFVDTSVLRIESTRPSLRITGETIARAASRDPVCAVVIWSSRFGRFSDLPARLQRAGYRRTATYAHDRSLWTRPCPVRR